MKLFDKMGEKFKEYKGKYQDFKKDFEEGRDERRTKEIVTLKKRQELLREQVKTKQLENQLQKAKGADKSSGGFGPKINFNYSNPSLTEANPLKKRPKKPETVAGFQGTNPYQLY